MYSEIVSVSTYHDDDDDDDGGAGDGGCGCGCGGCCDHVGGSWRMLSSTPCVPNAFAEVLNCRVHPPRPPPKRSQFPRFPLGQHLGDFIVALSCCSFFFEDLLPGRYNKHILKNELCMITFPVLCILILNTSKYNILCYFLNKRS